MEALITLGNDVLNRFEKSVVVYKLIANCKVAYVGQTGRLLNTRVEEHIKNILGENVITIMFYLIIERILTLTLSLHCVRSHSSLYSQFHTASPCSPSGIRRVSGCVHSSKFKTRICSSSASLKFTFILER